MRVMVMIIGKSVDIIGWRRMVKEKTTLAEVVSDNWYVPLGCVNEHLKWENW